VVAGSGLLHSRLRRAKIRPMDSESVVAQTGVARLTRPIRTVAVLLYGCEDDALWRSDR
jgi:hypothetical protein